MDKKKEGVVMDSNYWRQFKLTDFFLEVFSLSLRVLHQVIVSCSPEDKIMVDESNNISAEEFISLIGALLHTNPQILAAMRMSLVDHTEMETDEEEEQLSVNDNTLWKKWKRS